MAVTVPYADSYERTKLGETSEPFDVPKDAGRDRQATPTTQPRPKRTVALMGSPKDAHKNDTITQEIERARIALGEEEAGRKARNARMVQVEGNPSENDNEEVQERKISELGPREWEAYQVLSGFSDNIVVHRKAPPRRVRAGPSTAGPTQPRRVFSDSNAPPPQDLVPQKDSDGRRVLRPRDKQTGRALEPTPTLKPAAAMKPRQVKALPIRSKKKTVAAQGASNAPEEGKSVVTESGRRGLSENDNEEVQRRKISELGPREWEAYQVLSGFSDNIVVHRKAPPRRVRAGPSTAGPTQPRRVFSDSNAPPSQDSAPQQDTDGRRVLRPRDKQTGRALEPTPTLKPAAAMKPRQIKALPKRSKEKTLAIQGASNAPEEGKSVATESGRPKRNVGRGKKLTA